MNDKTEVRHTKTGRVVSDRGDKSLTVLIERKEKHPLYKKYVRKSTKIHVHDENNDASLGDTVVISQCRPISKTKSWRLEKVETRATKL